MELPNSLKHLFKAIEKCKNDYIEELRHVISIPSVSSSIYHRQHLGEMAHWMASRLRKLGVAVTLKDLGTQMLPDGTTIPYPPLILGTLKAHKKHKTLCVYGHLDVMSVAEDNWYTNPFELTERDGKLYGRGTSDNKGPLMCWIHAIEAYQTLGYEVHVDIKFIIETMRECSNYGLYNALTKDTEFLKDIDYYCVTDSFWLGNQVPCLSYGSRGLSYFTIEIDVLNKNMNVETFNGIVYDGLADMVYLLDSLVDNRGNVLVKDIHKNILPVSVEEKEMYSNIDFDVYEFSNLTGGAKVKWESDKVALLTHLWRYPSLTIHSIETPEQLSLTTHIPRKVIGKFSIRTVPNQTVEEVREAVTRHLNNKWQERDSPNTMKINVTKEFSTNTENPKCPNYAAARRAIQMVYEKTPDFIRDGNTNTNAVLLENITGKDVLMLPLFPAESGFHCANEKIYIRHYIDGAKVLAAYLRELSLMS